MNIRPIKNDTDLAAALSRIEEIFHAPDGTPEAEELEVLGVLAHEYEAKHHAVAPPSPVAAIEHAMDRLALRQVDLVPYIGAESRVSEILNGKRPLTVQMIRRLHEGLGIPLSSLIGIERADVA